MHPSVRTRAATLVALILTAACGEVPSGAPDVNNSPVRVLRNGALLAELPTTELENIPHAGERWTLDEVFAHLGEPVWFYAQVGPLRLTPRSEASLGILDGGVSLQVANGRPMACVDMHLAVPEKRADGRRAAKGATPRVQGLGDPFDLDSTQLGRVEHDTVLRRGGPVTATPLWELLRELGGGEHVYGVRLAGHRGHTLDVIRPTDGTPRWSRVYLMRNNRGGFHVLLDAAPAEEAASDGKAGGGGHGSSRAQGGGKDPQSTGELRHLTEIVVLPTPK